MQLVDWGEWKYELKTADQLLEIVRGICDGEIFTSDHVSKEDMPLLPSIFLATNLFGGPKFSEAMHREDIEMFYARYACRGPMSVGKYPVFLGCGFLNTNEAARIRASVEVTFKHREQERQRKLEENNRGEASDA